MTYVGSQGARGADYRVAARRMALAFFVGITLSLFVLGTLAAWLGRLIGEWSGPFALAAAIFSILVGLAALAGPVIRRRIPSPRVVKSGGVTGAFVYGLLYTVATLTTSAGPLVLLLTIAAAMGEPLYGGALSLAYGVGRGAPFLLLGLFAERVSGWISRLERGRRALEVVSGLALVGVGVYFLNLAGQLA